MKTRRRPLLVLLSLSLMAVGCTATQPEQAPYSAPSTTAPVDLPPRSELREFPGTPVTRPAFRRPEKQPNFLVMTTDDSAMKDMEFMPRVEAALADEGVTLDQVVAQTPLCVPSRASLLTGQYSHNHGAHAITGPESGVSALDDSDTLPLWLQDAGYDTLFVGKYLNGYGETTPDTYVPPGWTDWRATVDPSTYDYFDHELNVNGTVSRHPGEYSTTLLREQALDMLDEPRREQKPWMMWFNFVAPHHGVPAETGKVRTAAAVPDDRDRDTFSDLELPDTPEMFEEDPSDKTLSAQSRQKVDEQGRAEMRLARQRRVEALQAVDRTVGQLVDTLRRSGQLDNTYVLFTSDNGYALGEHNMRGKLWHFDDMLRVPAVMRGPGLPAGTTVSTPMSNADWAPTIAALAGARTPDDVDGTNVFPWFSSDATKRVIPVMAWKVADGSAQIYRGVSVGPWTFATNRRGRHTELYDRRSDPRQLTSLSTDKRFRPWLRTFRALTKQYASCAGETCQSGFYR